MMASIARSTSKRALRTVQPSRYLSRPSTPSQPAPAPFMRRARARRQSLADVSSSTRRDAAALHSYACLSKRAGHNGEENSGAPPATDLSMLDMLGSTPPPSTSIDVCMTEGFKLNSGVFISNGLGVMLVGGEAFTWQPWGPDKRLVNSRGQWEVGAEAFALFDLLWPRPDLLILGLGPELRPLSPATRRCISSLGLRVEALDTRNAASQFNMLATERGVDDVAAALVPIGWKEGLGAKYD